MNQVETLEDARVLVGSKLGTSDWLLIEQGMLDDFARITNDQSWIHVDVGRARLELPEGKTIAQGMLTLSLAIHLGATIFGIRRRRHALNYGTNRVRFTCPVKVGSRIRLHRSLKNFAPVPGGARLTFEDSMEIEGETRLALVAEIISLVYADTQ